MKVKSKVNKCKVKPKKNKMKKSILLLSAIMCLASCQNVVRNIPSGYVGKMLTPTGYSDEILEAGQADLGEVKSNGTSTSLILLEVTTTTIKESFDAAGSDPNEAGDHRVRTKDGAPVAVDIYVQVAVPQDKKLRDGIFSMISPQATGDARVSSITIGAVYSQFAKMTIRGNVRSIFAKYQNVDSVYANYARINAEISLMVIDVIKQSKAPFEILNAQLSNVKEDPTILDSKNKLVAAQNEVSAAKMLGEAIAKNPNYLEMRRLQVLEKIGSDSKSTIIVMDTKSGSSLAIPYK
jgi:regulator of protease activity HflC (stomatin/prohibitin superfamily)